MNVLRKINPDVKSYNLISSLFNENKNKKYSNININIQDFFSANMSAALGAVLDILKSNSNSVNVNTDNKVKQILVRNEFLKYYGYNAEFDNNNTTIKYQRIKPTDGRFFKNYIIKELIEGHISDLPNMSKGAKEKIIESIYEIFANAQIHSETEFIYTCGQFFPQNNNIDFTIVDTGVGFREKVKKAFNKSITSEQAIKWAVQDKNTTKQGVPGGIGLAFLREFIKINKGKIQIVSYDGFYEYSWNKEFSYTLNSEYPGTIVNLRFKTDDSNSYSLIGEFETNDIF